MTNLAVMHADICQDDVNAMLTEYSAPEYNDILCDKLWLFGLCTIVSVSV